MNLETVLTLLIQGAFLIIGIYIGERITMKGFEKRLTKMFNRSKTAQKLLSLINDPNLEKDVNNLLKNAAGFFEEARALVSSPEAKNFFKNASELVEQFSSDSPKPHKVSKLPEKP